MSSNNRFTNGGGGGGRDPRDEGEDEEADEEAQTELGPNPTPEEMQEVADREKEDEEKAAPDGDVDPTPRLDHTKVQEETDDPTRQWDDDPVESDPNQERVDYGAVRVSDPDDATSRDDAIGEQAREYEQEAMGEFGVDDSAMVSVTYEEDANTLNASLTSFGEDALRRRHRWEAREDAASEFDAFGPGDFTIDEVGDELAISLQDDAIDQYVRTSAAEEYDEFGPEDFTVDREGDELAVSLQEDAREDALDRYADEYRDDLVADLEELRPVAEEAPDHPTPGQLEDVAEYGGLLDFEPDAINVGREGDEIRVGVDEQAQLDALRQRVAARDDRLEPQDIVVEETDGGFTARADEDALAEALRQDLADEHEGVEAEDVEITIEDGEVSARAEVEEERRRIRDLVDVDIGFDRTALVDVDRRPISVDVESNIEAPDIDDLDKRTIPPTAVDDFEASVLNDVLRGTPEQIREVEEGQLGPRATRQRDFTDDLMDEVTKRIDSDTALSGAAAAGAVGVAAPEPASSIGGAGVLLGVGAVAGAGIAVDAARRNELDVSRSRVEEVGVGATITEEELDVAEDVGRTTQVEMAERVAELDVAERNLAEIDIPADEFVAGASPQMAGQIGIEEPRRSSIREDSRTDIQRLIEDGDDVFEGRRDPRGAFREERAYPTGESAVIGREVERVEEAQTSEVAQEDITRNLEEFDVSQQLQVDVSPLSAPLSGLDPMSDTAIDLDVGLDAAGQQVQALEAQSTLQQQQLLQETASAPGFADPTANIPDYAEGVGTGFGTGVPGTGAPELPAPVELPDPVPSDRSRDLFDLAGVEVEFEVPTAEEIGADVEAGLGDVGIDMEGLGQ